MGFIDPVSAFIRWGYFKVSPGQTTVYITHGAAFTPERIVLFPKDPYAWAGQAVATSYGGTTFRIDLLAPQDGDAAYEYVVGKN